MDITLRFRSMEKAMIDVIIPALDPGKGLAIEQAHFLLYHLQLISARYDKDLHLQLAELREIRQYAQTLLETVPQSGGDDSATQQARDLLSESDPIAGLQLPSRERVIELVTALKKAVDSLLRNALDDDDPERRRLATERAMSYAERDITRRRVWVKDAGYDLEADALPPLEQVLT